MSGEVAQELVPALAIRRCLSSLLGVCMSLWGLKNAANNFIPAEELLAASVSQFSRLSPLRIVFRSPTLRVGGGSRTDSSNQLLKPRCLTL